MGVDYDSKLVCGMSLEYNDFLKAVRMFTERELKDEEVEKFYYENGEENDSYNIFSEKYKGMILGMASPHNNCDFHKCNFYVSVGKGEEKIDSKEIISLIIFSDYIKFLSDIGIPYVDPIIFSLLHVY